MDLNLKILGDKDEIHRLAVLYDRKANELVDFGDSILRRFQQARWSCGAAERARRAASDRRLDAHRQAERMRRVASRLRELERVLRNQIVDSIN